MKTSHIQVKASEAGVIVVIDDCELFDFVEDLFTENGLEYAYSIKEEREDCTVYVIHFEADVSIVNVKEVVDAVPDEEIERICSLN